MKIKKLLALLLVGQMLLASLAACSDPNPSSTETNSPGTNAVETKAPETKAPETNAPETELSRADIADDLPDMSFNGQEFRILTTAGSWEYQYLFDEENTADTLNMAIGERNRAVEERFDAKIVTRKGDQRSHETYLAYEQAGLDEFDVIDLIQYISWKPLGWGMLRDWSDIPYINLEKPWWNQMSNEEDTFDGKLYRLNGDLSLTSLQYSWTLLFNADLMKDWGYPAETLYQLVRDGEWTLDKMIEATAEIYMETDGDGVRSENDTYGYTGMVFNGTDQWVTGVGVKMMTKDDTGNLIINLGQEKTYRTLEKLVNYFYATEGTYCHIDYNNPPVFQKGTYGMTTSLFSSLVSMADVEFSYGILPYPKYDTAQDAYYGAAMDQLSVYGLPHTLPEEKKEFVGVMMESLNAESYKTVYPAYYDQVLKGRYSTDEGMAEMVDIIVESRMFDISFLYGGLVANLPYQFRYCIAENSTDLASKLAENATIMADGIETIHEFYRSGKMMLDKPET